MLWAKVSTVDFRIDKIRIDEIEIVTLESCC